jgi:hypothetical protein
MDAGSASIADLAAAVAGLRNGAARVVLGKPGPDGAPLLAATVIAGMDMPDWNESAWDYGHISFAAGPVIPDSLSKTLVPDREVSFEIGSTCVVTQFPATAFSWERKPSLAQYDRLALRWPTVIYNVPLRKEPPSNQPRYYIGSGQAPSFPSLESAYNAFMYDDYSRPVSGGKSLGQMSVRIADQRARIKSVRITGSAITVQIDGTDVAGTCLEINSADVRDVKTLAAAGPVRLPIPRGLPDDTWLWLKRDNDWLDYRALSDSYRSPDIEVAIPHDTEAELSRLISQGEGLYLEYKRKIPENRDEKRKTLKTIVAFANGEGGTLLFGVDNDSGVTGLTGTPDSCRSDLTNLIRDLITPSPHVIIETYLYDEKLLMIARVHSGSGTPHALVLDQNRPEFFVRRNSTTFYAKPDEIAGIARRAASAAAPRWW